MTTELVYFTQRGVTVVTTKRKLYAIEGYEIREKDTKLHSESARKIYLPSDWERVVIIDITERREEDG